MRTSLDSMKGTKYCEVELTKTERSLNKDLIELAKQQFNI